jgi:hypothetical protein
MPNKGFLASLFDLSFTSFITTKIIKFLYVVTLVVLGLVYLLSVIGAFNENPGLGVVVLLIVGPLLFLLWAIYSRVILEFVIAVFRIMETNAELAYIARRQAGGSAPPPAATAAGTALPQGPAPGGGSTPVRMSDDGEYWWDGSRWQSMRDSRPPNAHGAEEPTTRTIIEPDA